MKKTLLSIMLKRKNSNLFLVLIILHSFFFETIFWPLANYFNLTLKNSDLSVWKWSLIDNLTYLERKIDSNFLSNDFITNTLNESFSLRNIFNDFILFFSTKLNVDYYVILYFFDKIILLILPLTIFLFIKESSKALFNKTNNLIPFIFIILFSNPITYRLFEIAGHEPFATNILPYTLSLFISSVSFLLIKRNFLLSVLLNAMGILFHLQIGVFFSFITPFIYFNYFKKNIKYLIIWISAFTLVILFIKFGLIQSNISTFDANSFILRHQHHYDINYIIYNKNNVVKFLIFIFLSILFVFFQKKRIQSYTLIISSIACIILQYLVINVVNINVLKIFSPIRFVMFSPIFLAIFITPYFKDFKCLPKISNWVILSIFFCFLSVLMYHIDDPKIDQITNNKEFYDAIQKTDINSTFFVDYNNEFFKVDENLRYLNQNIRVISKRNIMISREWPFNFSNIEEYAERSNLMKINFPQKSYVISCEDLKRAKDDFGLTHLVTFESKYCYELNEIYSNSGVYIYSLLK